LAEFQALISFLLTWYRVIAYSRRSHLPNKIVPSDQTYAAERHAEDLAALLAVPDAGRANLVGSACGAYVMLIFQQRNRAPLPAKPLSSSGPQDSLATSTA
jgi:pimeloyl-ACP methyl ester carboxylesterase